MVNEYSVTTNNLWLMQSQIDTILDTVRDGTDMGIRVLNSFGDRNYSIGTDTVEIWANIPGQYFVIDRFASAYEVLPKSSTKLYVGAFDTVDTVGENLIALLGQGR